MTASQPATAGSDSAHAQIAEAAARWRAGPASPNAWDVQFGEDIADVLVAVGVDALLAEAKAEALTEMAAHTRQTCAVFPYGHDLADEMDRRAAAYRTNPSKETDRG